MRTGDVLDMSDVLDMRIAKMGLYEDWGCFRYEDCEIGDI
jgi:hypothetical protein